MGVDGIGLGVYYYCPFAVIGCETLMSQVVWSAVEQKYLGMVNMHLPDAWGLLYFGDAAAVDATADETWPHRVAAMSVYYAQHAFAATHSRFASNIVELADAVDHQVRHMSCSPDMIP